MKKNFTIALISIAFVCGSAFAQKPPAKKPLAKPKPVPAQTSPKQKSETSSDNQAAGAVSSSGDPRMQKWMEYMTPGPMHEMLAKFNGKWKEEVTIWMAPGAPPTNNTAVCVNTMIMDNRYQESKHSSVMNGMPFEGTGILGYDNAKQAFVTTWIDNMGTGIMYLEGQWDEKNKSIHFKGKSVDPMTGTEMGVREDFKIIDDNHQKMEMYVVQKGNEYKNMEIMFSR